MRRADTPPAGRWLLWLSLGGLALLQALLLYKGFHGGLLSQAIPWDDCSILDLALLRLARAAGADSLLGLALKAQDLAPHSPVADIQSMVGYLLSGGGVWGPFVLNIALPAACIAAAWSPLRRRGALFAAGVLLVVVFQPLTVYALTNLKADWKGGVAATLAIYVFFEALDTGDKRDWRIASTLLGVAVLCKLTAFYVPVLALLVLGLFRLADVIRTPGTSGSGTAGPVAVCKTYLAANWREVLLNIVLVAGPYALFFAYGATSHFNTLKYILHALSSTWTDGLSTQNRAALYLPPQNPAWGAIGWFFSGAVVVSLVIGLVRRLPRFVETVVLSLLSAGLFFAPLVFAKTSNIEFGATFVGICSGATLVMLMRLAMLFRFGGLAFLVTAAVISLFSTFGTYHLPLTKLGDGEYAAQARGVATYRQVIEDIIALRPSRDVNVDVYYEDSLVPHPNLGLMYFERTGLRLNTERIDQLDANAGQALAGAADFVLVLSPTPGVVIAGYAPAGFQWTTGHQAEARAHVQALPGVVLLKTYPWANGVLELYGRPTPQP